MQKSDRLKEKVRITEITTQIPHSGSRSNMDMALNDCDKIRTHKNMFEDQKFKKEGKSKNWKENDVQTNQDQYLFQHDLK